MSIFQEAAAIASPGQTVILTSRYPLGEAREKRFQEELRGVEEKTGVFFLLVDGTQVAVTIESDTESRHSLKWFRYLPYRAVG